MRALLLALAVGACNLADADDERVTWLSEATFASEIQPALAERCGNPTCHGRPERALSIYSAGQWRADPARTHLPEPLTAAELTHNYRSSCVSASDYGYDAPLLLLKPLGSGAGVYHGGGAVFADPRDRDYLLLERWIEEGWSQ